MFCQRAYGVIATWCLHVVSPDPGYLFMTGECAWLCPEDVFFCCLSKAPMMIYHHWIIFQLPSGKLSHSYGKIHHFVWVNPLFRLGHFLCRIFVCLPGRVNFKNTNADWDSFWVELSRNIFMMSPGRSLPMRNWLEAGKNIIRMMNNGG